MLRVTQSLTLSTSIPLGKWRDGKPAAMVSSKDIFGSASVFCIAADGGFLLGVDLSHCHLGLILGWKPVKLFCLRKSGLELLLSPLEPGMLALKGGSPRAVRGRSISHHAVLPLTLMSRPKTFQLFC